MAAKEQSVALTAAGSAENYEADFYEWTQSTAEMIRQGRFSEVDWEHVAEEINDMGLRDHREVRSRLIVLIMHLLKWQLQPEKRARSTWRSTIVEQRRELELVMADSPSLARIPREALPRLYRAAVKDAIKETGINAERFPEFCPYTAEQVLDGDFLPDSA
jgi:hypothetical protein